MRFNTQMLTIPAAVMLTVMTCSAYAASATTQVNMVMRVLPEAAKCSVSSSAATFRLPSAASTATLADYLASAGLSTATNNTRNADSSYNQTATITCEQLTTPITSVSVEPASPGSQSGGAYLIDKDGARAFNGNLQVAAEIVSTTNLNSSAGGNAFSAEQKIPVTPSFGDTQATSGTDVKAAYDASFVWRPTVLASGDQGASRQNSVFGAAAGGTYETKYIVTVNY